MDVSKQEALERVADDRDSAADHFTFTQVEEVEQAAQEHCEPASSQRTSLQHAQPPRCDRHISRARGTPETSRAQAQLEK